MAKEGALRKGGVGQLFRFIANKILATRPTTTPNGKAVGKDKRKTKKEKKEKTGLTKALTRGRDILEEERRAEEILFGKNKNK